MAYVSYASKVMYSQPVVKKKKPVQTKAISTIEYGKLYGCHRTYVDRMIQHGQLFKLPHVIKTTRHRHFHIVHIPITVTKENFWQKHIRNDRKANLIARLPVTPGTKNILVSDYASMKDNHTATIHKYIREKRYDKLPHVKKVTLSGQHYILQVPASLTKKKF